VIVVILFVQCIIKAIINNCAFNVLFFFLCQYKFWL